MKRHIQQYIVLFPNCKLFDMLKNIWKVWSIFNRQNFTQASNLSEISPTGNPLVKIMLVNFLHQVNCETKYTIPEKFK